MKLALIQDYHSNFYDTYKELEKHHELAMFGDSYFDIPKDINNHYWKTNIKGRFYWADGQLYKMLKEFQPDKAIIKGMLQPKALIAITICKLLKIPYVIMVQNLTTQTSLLKGVLFRGLVKYIGTDTPIICSVLDRFSFLKHEFNSVTYIPFAIEPKDYKLWVKKPVFNVLSVGKLNQERKDQLLLLDALEELDYPVNVTLVGSCKSYNLHFHQLAFHPSNPILKADLDKKAMGREYSVADLFVLPSYNEPANYAVLEAMSYGLPVICSDTNGTKCYMKNKSYVFKSRDKESLKKCLKKILNYDTLQYEGRLNQVKAETNHSPFRIVQKLNKVLK